MNIIYFQFSLLQNICHTKIFMVTFDQFNVSLLNKSIRKNIKALKNLFDLKELKPCEMVL